MAQAPAAATTDRRRLRGERTRHAILSHAAQLASSEGLEAVSAELDSKPGPVRDAAIARRGYWAASLARAAREAQRAGEVRPEVDPEQLAWELDCLLCGANNGFIRDAGAPVLERARRAIRERLEGAATASAARLPTR